MKENKILPSRALCRIGEALGFMSTGYLIATGSIIIPIIAFAVSWYLSDCAIEETKKEVKDERTD